MRYHPLNSLQGFGKGCAVKMPSHDSLLMPNELFQALL